MLIEPVVHYFLHFGFPLLIAITFFRKDWKKTYLLLMVTMLIDLDHLFATPIFDAKRCSINFHFLHSYYAMIIYVPLLFLKKPYRIIGIGLLFHLLTDLIDCVILYDSCNTCLSNAPAIDLIKQISNLIGR